MGALTFLCLRGVQPQHLQPHLAPSPDCVLPPDLLCQVLRFMPLRHYARLCHCQCHPSRLFYQCACHALPQAHLLGPSSATRSLPVLLTHLHHTQQQRYRLLDLLLLLLDPPASRTALLRQHILDLLASQALRHSSSSSSNSDRERQGLSLSLCLYTPGPPQWWRDLGALCLGTHSRVSTLDLDCRVSSNSKGDRDEDTALLHHLIPSHPRPGSGPLSLLLHLTLSQRPGTLQLEFHALQRLLRAHGHIGPCLVLPSSLVLPQRAQGQEEREDAPEGRQFLSQWMPPTVQSLRLFGEEGEPTRVPVGEFLQQLPPSHPGLTLLDTSSVQLDAQVDPSVVSSTPLRSGSCTGG